MRIGIYKDTLANRRGADAAVLALADGLRERLGVGSCELGVGNRESGIGSCEERAESSEVVVFEKKDLEKRIKEPWDVIISTGTNELLDLDAWLRRRFPIPDSRFPIIQQFHTNPKSQFKWKRFVRNWKIRRALRHVSAIQVLSEEFVPQVEKYGVPVHVIGNWSRFSCEIGVESLELPTPNSQFPIPNSRFPIPNSQLTTPPLTHSPTPTPTIIYPAAFSKSKNQKLLIKAFAQVAAEFLDWKLRLFGRAEGAYADGCRRLVAETGIAGKVEFAGFCDDLAGEYGRCEFVAFPSIDEGFPLSVADAAAFAKPCVMVKDWIGTGRELELGVGRGGVGGIVTEPTVEAYAEGLRRLMSDADLRRSMGENARTFCAGRYSRDAILDRWERLLAETIARSIMMMRNLAQLRPDTSGCFPIAEGRL